MNDKKSLGNLGEDLACQYLIRNRFKILRRNKREKFYEIDIIAKSFDRTLVFIEVKTMRIYGELSYCLKPEDHMTKAKFNKIKNGCLMFSAKHPELVDDQKGWRIDLVAISLDSSNSFNLSHYENILF